MSPQTLEASQTEQTKTAKTFKVGWHNLKIKGKPKEGSPDKKKFSESIHWQAVSTPLEGLAQWIGEGFAWMPATLDEGKPRLQQHANYAEVFAIDVDNQTTIEEEIDGKKVSKKVYLHQMTIEEAKEHPFVKAYCSLAIPSASHTEGWDKYRLIFRSVKGAESHQNIRIVNCYLSHLLDQHKPTENSIADPNCKDASRFFYGAEGAKPFIFNEEAFLPESILEDAIEWNREIEAEKERQREAARKAWEARKQKNDYSAEEDEELMFQALNKISPNCSHNEWIDIGMALCAMGYDFSVWDAWSEGGSDYDPKETKSRWKSFKGKTGTPGNIFAIAKDHGFRFPKRERQVNNRRVGSEKPSKKQITSPEVKSSPAKGDDSARGDKKGNRTFPQKVSDALYEGHWICVGGKAGKLYQWTGSYYKISDDDLERRRIQKFADEYKESIYDEDGKEIGCKYPYAEPKHVNDAFAWIKMQFAVSFEECNPSGLNCTNGVLQISYRGDRGNVAEFNLIPHTPDLYYLYEPQATYDPSASSEDCDRMMSALEKPQQDVLMKVISASLDLEAVRRFHGRNSKALLTIGVGSNGKDTIREAVSAVFGGTGLTSASLEDFQQYDLGRKFPLAKLATSRINWASENRKGIAIDDLAGLKRAITGEELQSEKKGVDEKEFVSKAVFLFNLNDIPTLKAGMNAIDSRFAVIAFDKTFATNPDPAKGELQADPRFKYDRNFLKTNVLSAFVNRMVAAFQDLLVNGIDYSCCAESMEEIRIQNSHLFDFAKETGLVPDRGSVIPIKDLWRELKQFYIDTDALTIIEVDGKDKHDWTQDIRPGDPYVKSSNQVWNRFSKLFPQCKLVSVGHKTKGIKGLAFSPAVKEVEPPKNETPKAEPSEPTQAKLQQTETPVTTSASVPSWVKVGGCVTDRRTRDFIRVTEIVSEANGVFIKSPTGVLIPLSECEPERIPAGIQRGAV